MFEVDQKNITDEQPLALFDPSVYQHSPHHAFVVEELGNLPSRPAVAALDAMDARAVPLYNVRNGRKMRHITPRTAKVATLLTFPNQMWGGSSQLRFIDDDCPPGRVVNLFDDNVSMGSWVLVCKTRPPVSRNLARELPCRPAPTGKSALAPRRLPPECPPRQRSLSPKEQSTRNVARRLSPVRHAESPPSASTRRRSHSPRDQPDRRVIRRLSPVRLEKTVPSVRPPSPAQEATPATRIPLPARQALPPPRRMRISVLLSFAQSALAHTWLNILLAFPHQEVFVLSAMSLPRDVLRSALVFPISQWSSIGVIDPPRLPRAQRPLFTHRHLRSRPIIS